MGVHQRFKAQWSAYVLPALILKKKRTEYIYVFRMILRINNYYVEECHLLGCDTV
jgi:hypothetical protein